MSLDNLAIARVFAEIGDLLEIKNENPFKIRAYRNVSETIAHTAERMADLPAAARLAIPGIGKDLNAKITELVETGTIAYHQELLKEFPPTILDLLRLQGVGPKTVAMLYRDLGIGTLDDLERAAREGRLRNLKGMGAKKEAFILKALEERTRSAGRRLMAEAHETAAALVAALREHAPDAAISPVGSLRRGCETCGDLDILAAGAPPSLMDAFTSYKLVERVLAHGDTKSSVLLWGGFQADLRLVAAESLGAALQYFTGSKPHNIALRDRAIRRGFKLNEYGLFKNDGGQVVAQESEEEIYRALGLAYIPPELRECRGEIEAAEAGTLPALLMLADLHEPAEQPLRSRQLSGAQLYLGQRQEQHWIVAGAVLVEKLTRSGNIALFEGTLRQNRPRLALQRIDADELFERLNRFGRPALLEQVVVQRFEAFAGFLLLAHLFERACGSEPGVEI